MDQEMSLPRGSVIDLALLLEEHLREGEEEWCSGDQVMDIYRLKARLREHYTDFDETLSGIRLQGVAVVLTKKQKEGVTRGALELVETCLHILQACELLDVPEESDSPNS